MFNASLVKAGIRVAGTARAWFKVLPLVVKSWVLPGRLLEIALYRCEQFILIRRLHPTGMLLGIRTLQLRP